MLTTQGFPAFLKSHLLQGDHIRVYHVSTPASPCSPLFAPAPGRTEEATTLTSHFLSISQPRCQLSDSVDDTTDTLVLGIEVLVFTAADLTTIFVSKADSTGFLLRSAEVTSHRTSLVQLVITAFLEYLVKGYRDRNRLVVSLFARSQNQYLFPGSIENVTKHVLDDRQLIKWWCRVLDPLTRRTKSDGSQSVRAYLVVPGCDKSEIKTFFPSSSRSDSAADPVWIGKYPVESLVNDASLPPRCLVPRFPDDPKSRFLADLDSQRDGDGIWRGIKSLEQFWEMMSYRQECSAGRLVGFVWLVMPPLTGDIFVNDATIDQQKYSQKQDSGGQIERTPASDVEATARTHVTDALVSVPVTATVVGSHVPPSPTDLAPAEPHVKATTQPKFALASSGSECLSHEVVTENGNGISASQADDTTSSESTIGVNVPSTGSSGEMVVMSSANYQLLMEELLQLDFAGEHTAAESSKRWRSKAMELAVAPQFGVDVEGTASEMVAFGIAEKTSIPNINILRGVRKKRKADVADTSISTSSPQLPNTDVLATGLTRKKSKA